MNPDPAKLASSVRLKAAGGTTARAPLWVSSRCVVVNQ